MFTLEPWNDAHCTTLEGQIRKHVTTDSQFRMHSNTIKHNTRLLHFNEVRYCQAMEAGVQERLVDSDDFADETIAPREGLKYPCYAARS